MYSSIRIGLYFLIVTGLCSSLFLFVSTPMPNNLDTKKIIDRQTCDITDVGHFINNLSLIKRSSKKKLFFFGASNSRDGFRPQIVKKSLPEFDIYNVGFSSGNVSEAILALDLIKASMQQEAYQGAYAILGVTFGVVVNNSIRWNNSVSPLELEISHYGLYEKSGHTIIKIHSDKVTSLYLGATLPFRCGKNLINQAVTRVKNIIKGEKKDSLASWDKARAIEQFEKWENAYKPDPHTITDEIANITQYVSNAKRMGMVPIIIDLPLDTLVYKYSRHDKVYRAVMINYLSDRSLDYIDMRHLGRQSEFKDLLHPTKETAKLWTDFLANEIINREHYLRDNN